MKRVLLAIILVAAFSLHAAAPPRGNDRLRELVVFPELKLQFQFGFSFEGNHTVIYDGGNPTEEISRRRAELKQQPEDIKRLLQLGYALDSNGETNESQSCYVKAEQLCRNRLAANPQDGLTLIDLGEALCKLGRDTEAESVDRHAVLVSSQEWRCWAGLGNFLANKPSLLFPNGLWDQVRPDQLPAQAVLDFQPSPDLLKKSEAACGEASQCFGRALALAPHESELLLQYAGYLNSSNQQNCLFRHWQDGEKLNQTAWTLASFSKETVATLQQAAELSPKNYQYISLAAYFECLNATAQPGVTDFSLTALPEATRQFIRDAMARLENLSEDPDKTTAVGALENLGALNILFGNAAAAAADLRRAISLDPRQDQAWDLLLLALTSSASPDEMTTACESRLKYKDSALNHLLLARAYEHQKKWGASSEQAGAALKTEPDNLAALLTAHIELMALALKQSTDPDFLSKAAEEYSSINDLYKKVPYSAESASRWRELALDLAIYEGLVNTPEYEASAKACAEGVLKQYPDDAQAREILSALN